LKMISYGTIKDCASIHCYFPFCIERIPLLSKRNPKFPEALAILEDYQRHQNAEETWE